jgi:hypothetical protein
MVSYSCHPAATQLAYPVELFMQLGIRGAAKRLFDELLKENMFDPDVQLIEAISGIMWSPVDKNAARKQVDNSADAESSGASEGTTAQ